MFDQIHPGEFHDLPDLRLIFSVVALGFAFLAHRFGIVGALHPHRQTIREKAVTIWAEGDLSLCELLQVNEFKRERKLFPLVVLTTINPYEPHQGLNIGFLFLTDLIFSQHASAPFLDDTLK
jgi:hypothetical protein